MLLSRFIEFGPSCKATKQNDRQLPSAEIRRLDASRRSACTERSGWKRFNGSRRPSGSTFEQECSQSLAQFEEVLAKADVFGAFRETDLVGMAGYRTQAGAKRAHKGFLWGMYVRSSARGTGVAKKPLVEAVLDHGRERVELVQLSVVSENEVAQRLYRSCGFVAYGHEVHALKQDGRYYDEVLMAVALDPRN